MANNIKGITVEIGGDTGPLSTALKGVNKTSGDLQSELKEVNKQLKFDPSNTTLLNQKMDLLKQNTQALEEKQKTLKTAVSQAQEQFEKGDLGADKVRAVEREYEKVTSQLKDTKTQLNEVEKSSGTFGEKVKATFSSVGAGIKKAFNWDSIKAGLGAAGIAVSAFLKGSLDEAKDAEKANADLEQSLLSTKGAAGMTMQSLEDLAQAMVESTTYSDDEVKSGESMLLTFTNIGKDVFPQATAAVLDFAQKMGTDPKNAALTLGKALNDPADGLSKLTRSGVTFTAHQQEQIKAMQKAGDTAGAQKLMIEELNKEFGGQAAAAADTYAGKQKQLENMLQELKETIGEALIPMLQAVLKPIAPILEAIAQFVSKNPQLTAAILATVAVIGTLVGGLSLANTVAGLFGHTMQLNEIIMTGGIMLAIMALIAVVALIISHWSQISTFFSGLWAKISSIFQTAINAIMSFFTVTIPQAWNNLVAFMQTWGPLILAVVAPIIGIPLLIIQHWSQIQTFFESLWNGIITFFNTTIPQWVQSFIQWINQLPYNIGVAIGTMIADIINFGVAAWNWVTVQLPKIIQGIITWFQQLPGKIWTFLTDIISKIGQWITGMGQKVAAGIPVLINTVATFFSELPGRIWTFLVDVVSKVIQWCTNLVSTAGTEIPKFVQTVVDFIGELPGKMLDIGKNIVTGIWDGINGAISWLHDKIASFCQGIVDGIKKNLKIHSPSQVLADEVGKYMALGIGQGFTDAMQSVTAAMAAAIPTSFDSSVQVRTAMAAAYGGYLTPAPAGTSIAESATSATGSTGDVKVYQYFQGKTPSPAEHARLTRNGLQQVVKKLKG